MSGVYGMAPLIRGTLVLLYLALVLPLPALALPSCVHG
jgi:ABC-type phosphate transport system permease subunit